MEFGSSAMYNENDYFDDNAHQDSISLDGIDTDNFSGDFEKDFMNFDGQLGKLQKVVAPTDRKVIIQGPSKSKPRSLKRHNAFDKRERLIDNSKHDYIGKDIYGSHYEPSHVQNIVVPTDRHVIIEGAEKLMLSKEHKDDLYKHINLYKGEKLNELILIIDNSNSPVDFTFELFNPSEPLDYLYSTSLNLNDKIQVGGGSAASYSDILFGMLANPTMLINAKFVYAGSNVNAQITQPITINQKDIKGWLDGKTIQPQLGMDTFQVANDILVMSFPESLGRPYIPDGLDIMQYKVLAGQAVTMNFYYKQIILKKLVFNEALLSKKIF